MNKKCAKCGKPATHKFVRIEANQLYDTYYCQEHAAEKSPYQKPKANLQLSELVAHLLGPGQMAKEAEGGARSVRCGHCGLALEAYRKTLILGCECCYDAFSEQLFQELRKFHGNLRHVGRRPGGGKEPPPAPSPLITLGAPAQTAEGAEAPTAPPPEAAPSDTTKAQINQLTREMEAAIAAEDFERAARCRDQIRELRQSG